MSTDLRRIHYSEIAQSLTGKRAFVHASMQIHAPCTAIELAEKISWDKTSCRPRLSELRDMGLIEETGERRNGEHVYRCISLAEAQRRAQTAEELHLEYTP